MAVNNALNVISTAIDFIEENIKEKITLDDISKHVNLSKFHLNRMFKLVTEQNLMGYVRARKLSDSIYFLLNSELKIIDVAAEYNFEYEQSYIRSFKNVFKISPDKFRKDKPILEVKDRLKLKQLDPIIDNGVIFSPKIIIKSGFTVIGKRNKIYRKEDEEFHLANEAGNDFYFNHRHKIENPKYRNIYIGLVKYPAIAAGYSYYIPSIEVSEVYNIPEGMEMVKVPSNKYAVFTYIGLHHPMHTNINNLKEIHQFIFAKWLPASSYIMADNYFFECINENIGRDDYCEIELFIPISDKVQ